VEGRAGLGDAGDEPFGQLDRSLHGAAGVAGITWWNLGDRTAVTGENEAMGGLMDAQLQSKAAYRALDQLINHTWNTQAKAQTDVHAAARLRGFYGKCEIEVTSGGGARKFQVNHWRGETLPHRLVLAWHGQ